jgi:Domain of unknown function (DUF4253)
MFQYLTTQCSGIDALNEWSRLRARGKLEGFYPVIIGDDDDLERLSESMELHDDNPALIIAAANELGGSSALQSIREREPDLFESVERGVWPSNIAHQSFVSHTDILTRKPKAQLYIAHLPTVQSHEALAYLKYGGWNECPPPVEQVAIHKMWSDRYGAEVVFATGDVIECRVGKPPTIVEHAFELAEQQFVYCTDIVFQGVQTMSALAACLKNHDVWYFWWD